ncbi:hypothetical protein BDQ17DRAFT_1369607 [Cyathus striatus]|nr:hypothetical protein BDQ17DRAFT_1369607 [Cyathus striatus]
MEPGRDLDEYGTLLFNGNLELVKRDYEKRVTEKKLLLVDAEDAEEKAKSDIREWIYKKRWGPTGVPIYNLLGQASIHIADFRSSFIGIAKFLIDTVEVPVDGKDYSGTTALSHCFSTKPAFDLEYAQLLYDAGGDVNNRNRYGGTVAHEIVMVYQARDKQVVQKAVDALNWFLQHGGNVDIADGDGCTARLAATSIERAAPQLINAIKREDKIRQAKGLAACACCGREDPTLMACSRCKKVRYCSPKVRGCQKWDWPRHKKGCKAAAT